MTQQRWRIRASLLAFACLILVTGCADSEPEDTASAAPVLRADPSPESDVVLPSQLRKKLKANENAKFQRVGNDIVAAELFQSGIKSIEPLRGLPLKFLDLGMTEVVDISPVEGMPLKKLILENTKVADLSPLKEMQLEVLQLQDTKVTDLTVLSGMPIRELNLMAVEIDDISSVAELPLETLWIPRTKVTDLSPIKDKPMVSLDIQGTQVNSLEAISGMKMLKRLNIADTPIADVSPLRDLRLQRITLTPETITSGMDIIRKMSSLEKIQTSMEGGGMSASDFWKKYDEGVWQSGPEPDVKSTVGEDASKENGSEPEAAGPKEKSSESSSAPSTTSKPEKGKTETDDPPKQPSTKKSGE